MKKRFIPLMLILSIILTTCLTGCDIAADIKQVNESLDEIATNTSAKENTPESTLPELLPLTFEEIKTFTPSISVYRDVITDVMYIRYRDSGGYAGMGGLTVMLEPETGKPLTLTRYMEIYKEKLETGDFYFVNEQFP